MTAALLELTGVACLRGQRLLFEGVDLALGPGDATIVAGPNGVGKSSLLRIAAGLLRPAAGTVRHGGACSWLGEQAALDGDDTLAAALGFWAALDDAPSGALDAACADMGVAHLRDVPVRFLSTGQRRRAAISRAIAGGAALWLLDEPANGLDRDGVAALGVAIAKHRATGGAVLVATHQPLPIDAPVLALGSVAKAA